MYFPEFLQKFRLNSGSFSEDLCWSFFDKGRLKHACGLGDFRFEGRGCRHRASVPRRPRFLRGKGYGHRAHVAIIRSRAALQ